MKKGAARALSGGASRLALAEQTAQRPRVGFAAELESSGDVEEHPLREEAVDLLVRRPTVLLHRGIQVCEFVSDDPPDVLVAARGVCLELDSKQVSVRQELHVCQAHQVEDRALLTVIGLSSGGLLEDQAGPLEPMPDDRKEQFPLRPEQLEQVWLRDTDGSCDRLRRRAAVATVRELAQSGDNDRVASF